jgi:hypothetical protein
MDSNTASAAAAAIEIIIANNNALMSRLDVDEAAIATLEAQVKALATTPVPTGAILQVPASKATSSGFITITPAVDSGSLDGQRIALVDGQSYLHLEYPHSRDLRTVYSAIESSRFNGNIFKSLHNLGGERRRVHFEGRPFLDYRDRKIPTESSAGPLVVVFKVDTTPLGGGFADVVGVQ